MATNKVETVITARDDSRQAIDSAVGGINRLKTAGDVVQAGFKGAAGGLATALLGVGFSATIKEAIDSLDKMDEAAERLGTTTETLSGLAYAGKLTGLEFDDVTSALGKFNIKLGEAATGNKEAVAWFKDVGVSIKDSSGKVKEADAAFYEVADAFASMKDGAEKNNLAADAFGKSWQKVVPLLNNGADGIRDLVDEGRALGAVIDGKLAKQAAEFNDNMDRLATASAAAGKSLAGEFLPALNTISENLVVAIRQSDGFWAALGRFATMNPFKDHATRLVEMRAEFEKLDFDLSNGRSKNESEDKRRLSVLEKEIGIYQKLQDAMTGTDKNDAGKRSVTRTPTDSGKKETAEATEEAKAYAKAMEGLAKASKDAGAAGMDLSATQKALYELMSSPTWAQMPETWRLAAVEQFEFAYASEQTAKEMERLNKLLGETESSKIEEARKDMQLLAKALEDGRISEEQFTEAVQARFKDGNEKIKEQKSLAEELGLTFQSSFEEAVAGGGKFSDVLKGLEQDIIKIITRMTITKPLTESMKGFDWSGALSSIGSFFSPSAAAAKGAWFDGEVSAFANGGAFTNSVVGSPTLFKFANGGKLGLMGEAGPEAIMPLKRDGAGRLGVSAEGMGGGSVTVNVINNSNSTARTERRTDEGGNSVIDVIIEQVKGSIASDIARGSGSVPGAIEGTYGVRRSAGAY